jgi:hypothetical protein
MTDILTKLAALHEHPRTSELREHIRRGYGYRAVGAERVWSLHEDEMQVLNTGFTCLDDRCKSLIALLREAAAEIERLKGWQTLALAIGEREEERLKERELQEEEPAPC